MTKATHKKTIIDVLKNQKRQNKKVFGLSRQNLAGYSSVSGGLAVFHQSSTASSGGGNVTSLIKAAGDTMVGPMAYFLAEEDIASGELDVSQDGGYSSRVVVGSESGTTDNLVRISGSIHAGQILFLQGKSTDTITIKHYTTEGGTKGNIYMPSGNDYTLAAKEIVLFQWDEQNVNPTYSSDTAEVGQWTLVATSQGSGSSSWVGTATSQLNMDTFSIKGDYDGGTDVLGIESDLDMNTFDIKDLCRLEFEQGGQTLDGAVTGIDATGDKMHFNVPTGDYHSFTVNNAEVAKIDGTDFGIWNYLKFNSHTNGTNQPAATADGYIEIKIGTSLRKLYFYT